MEKRKTSRVGPYVAPCKIASEATRISAYVLDLSQSGAHVSSKRSPPGPGAGVTLELRLAGSLSASKISAVVRWVQPPFGGGGGMYHFGLGFDALDAETAKVLDAVLEDFRRRAAELAR